MKHTQSIVRIALITALALILSYIESLIPLNFGIPGAKIGLANAASVFVLWLMGAKYAFVVSVLRILLSSLLFGTPVSFIYAISGGILSLLAMILLKKLKFNMISVSAIGGVIHNIAQLIVALIVLETPKLIYYAPVLIIVGLIAGIFIGVLSSLLIKKIPLDKNKKSA